MTYEEMYQAIINTTGGFEVEYFGTGYRVTLQRPADQDAVKAALLQGGAESVTKTGDAVLLVQL